MEGYNRSNVTLAKNLRKNMTPWERKLWYLFLRKYPIRFQRQKPIGNYIADFYCIRARLIVELDGSGHYEARQIERDAMRTDELKRMGFEVVRISNAEIDRHFDNVCEYLDRITKSRLQLTK